MVKYRKFLVVFIVSIFLLSGMLTGAVAIKINDEEIAPNQSNTKRILPFRGFLLGILERFLEQIQFLKDLGDDEGNDGYLISLDGCLINLPSTFVLADIQEILGAAPLNSYLSTELSGISGSYDVENKIYPGWCIDYHTPLPFGDPMPIPVMLYSSYCPPEYLADDGWEEVNYILNHKGPGASWGDIHKAINQFVNFGDVVDPPDPLSIAGQMVSAAQANSDFIPQLGDVVAVIVDPLEVKIGIFPIENEWGCHERWQYTIIEVPIPEIYEGFTPGYWKNKGVKLGWPSPYIPKDASATTLDGAGFNIPDGLMNDNPKRVVDKDDTLLEALNYKGGTGFSGAAQSLLRQAVAALLNAAQPDVNYPLTEGEVISQVNTALASDDRDTMLTLKDELDYNNNL